MHVASRCDRWVWLLGGAFNEVNVYKIISVTQYDLSVILQHTPEL